MKYFFALLFALSISLNSKSQSAKYSFYQLYQLDSIGKGSSISRHFGQLYYQFLLLVEQQLENADTSTQRLVRNFEMVFAQFYIDACIAYKNHQQIALPAWRTYFTDTTLLPAQYMLLGANAHLNGGLSEAIAGSYTPDQWQQMREKYYLFNRCLNETYKLVYKQTSIESKRARALSVIMLGLDRTIGRVYLYKWRKRQMRLTEYYFYGSPRYKKSLHASIKKKTG